MRRGLWFRLLVVTCLIAGSLVGAVGAAVLAMDWKERAPEEGPYLGVMMTPDASLVYTGGNAIYVRSWNGKIRWPNRPARVAALSNDGQRVAIGVGSTLAVLDNRGIENWSRSMDGYVKAVAMSPDGSYIVSADDKGNYNLWDRDGDLVTRLYNRSANAIAYAPTGDLVVVATERGLRFYDRRMDLVWFDNRSESLDTFIAVTGDGSTVIVAGYNQVASYSRDGTLSWRKEITQEPIIDMHCSYDGSTIIVAGQDKEIIAIDRSGSVRWKYGTGQWVNAVGVSDDASVIAAGGIDRTVYILDYNGVVVARKKTDAIIQPRSVAVSSDGKKIVVADQLNLYGFSVTGDGVTAGATPSPAPAPLNPPPTTALQEVPKITLIVTAAPPPVITTPSTVPASRATYAPLNLLLSVLAPGAAGLFIRRLR